jgi:hypothetical protein
MKVAGLLLMVVPLTVGAMESNDPRVETTRRIAMEMGKTLKERLLYVIEQQGITGAVDVCAEAAPAIAAELSERHGVMVRRVSLRARNPANQPDAWERMKLESTEMLLAQTNTVRLTESYAGGTAEDHESEVRYLRYLYMEPLCLTCHGSVLSPEVEAVIKQRYPDDQATGYGIDELRGAISVRFPIPP